ncbi:hypothetical protein IAG44_26165 [Streptomyces roseirectus]|uniref:Secreted protein n=1 Tax=Streptomyces roseirectus TaxID=2768066 RepID=A0A7H0IIF1_9ACTN|nr:hypothetical protein [Streptomyces roseirectus]QNP72567.1 hypothetical protein IAG44_26165 [Streptomyces roseirectus]
MRTTIARRLALTGAAGLLAGTGVLVQAGPASAATGRSDACGKYACGSGTFTWGKKTLKGAMSVKFPCGKGLVAGQIRVIVTGTDGRQQFGAPRIAGKSKCGKYTLFPNLSWKQKADIRFFQVEVASTKGQGPSGFHSYRGNVVDNPLT